LLNRLHLPLLRLLLSQRWQREVSLQINRVQCIHIGLLLVFFILHELVQSLFLSSGTNPSSSLITFLLRCFVFLKVGNSIFLKQQFVLLVGVHWLLLVAIVIIKLVQFEIGPYLTIKHLDLIIVHIFDQLLLLDFVLLLHYLWDFI